MSLSSSWAVGPPTRNAKTWDRGRPFVSDPRALRTGRPRSDVFALRVGGPTAHEELVVQVRAGRQARRTDVTDRLLLPDLLPHVQPAREGGEVAVARADAVPVPQLDHVAVAA